ncbi:transmembrane 220 family protein [Marinoscillum furvescens]|uniref:Transmembrane family 220 protein n=1 Tax=Marinoscillum furvescens DSM 4134 TaxID=1122208 RepID=A0A3D9L141_MARFU|nr:transmembrane 220 family protein [Marinoscillum furvescens]RED95595.1 transmembrane family 220 protein [Marinoscillum furvescens DSM 4134]
MSQKLIHYLVAGVFALFAALQLNDPDPLLWVLLYGVVAVVAVLKVFLVQISLKPLITTFIVIFLVYAATYVPSFLDFLDSSNKGDLVGKMKASTPWIEGTRELLGLLIAVGGLIYLRQSKVA